MAQPVQDEPHHTTQSNILQKTALQIIIHINNSTYTPYEKTHSASWPISGAWGNLDRQLKEQQQTEGSASYGIYTLKLKQKIKLTGLYSSSRVPDNGGGGLVASVWGIPAQSPKFESPNGLATFIWNNRHNTILDGTGKFFASRSFRWQHVPLNKKCGVTVKI